MPWLARSHRRSLAPLHPAMINVFPGPALILVSPLVVPQRFHGGVFALNQMIAWSTLPLGFLILAPLALASAKPQ